jgi:hypothetical protein
MQSIRKFLMIYSAYAEFCRLIGYKVLETPQGIWIGPSHGFFNRMPLYETAPPTEQEMKYLFKQHRILGVNYAAEPGWKGQGSHNYFVRDRNYSLRTLDKKGRWSVQKGLDNCQVRPMSFEELQRLGMPLNLGSLSRQGRSDRMFTSEDQWRRLCRAGERLDQVEAWGSFVGDELGAYLISIRLGSVVSLLYSNASTSLLTSHPSPALFFSVIQTMMKTPGVEAVYNGPRWLTDGEGLDRFKQRLGFVPEPIVFVLQLRPIASRVLLNRGLRRAISSLGPRLFNSEFHRRIEAVLNMADVSS